MPSVSAEPALVTPLGWSRFAFRRSGATPAWRSFDPRVEPPMTEDVKRVGLLIPSPGVVTRDEFSRLFAGANTVFHEVAPPSQPETEGWQLPRFELEGAVRALVAKKVDVIVHAGVLPSVSLGIERESQDQRCDLVSDRCSTCCCDAGNSHGPSTPSSSDGIDHQPTR